MFGLSFVVVFCVSCFFTSMRGSINLRNWAGTFKYGTQNIQYPRSESEVIEIVTGARRVRCLGQRHSFSRIADSNDTILATIGLKNIRTPSWPNVLSAINPLDPTVWVQAGITYTDLAPFLQQIGYGLPNLASLAEISIAGAMQTGTHGSGNTLGCLATQIRSMELVLANGALVIIPAGNPLLKALSVGLGAFGVITAVELELEKTYDVANYVFLNLPHTEFMAQFEEIMTAGYNVQVYSDFLIPGVWNHVWVIERADANSTIGNQPHLANTGATRSTQQTSPMIFLPPEYISGGDEIQTEYFVKYEDATAAINAVYAYRALLAPVLWYAGIRTVKNDDLWMSMSYGQEEGDGVGVTVAIGLTFKPQRELVDPVLALVEQALIPFCARPHWGKHYLMGPDKFLHCYPKLNEFRALAEIFDAGHKFRNEYLERNVFTGDGANAADGIDLTTLPDDILQAVQAILANLASAGGGLLGDTIG